MPPQQARELGVVTVMKANYGFIKCCARDNDLFFHFTAVEGGEAAAASLVVGTDVMFSVALDARGGKACAVNVVPAPPGAAQFESVHPARLRGWVRDKAKEAKGYGALRVAGTIEYEVPGEGVLAVPYYAEDVSAVPPPAPAPQQQQPEGGGSDPAAVGEADLPPALATVEKKQAKGAGKLPALKVGEWVTFCLATEQRGGAPRLRAVQLAPVRASGVVARGGENAGAVEFSSHALVRGVDGTLALAAEAATVRATYHAAEVEGGVRLRQGDEVEVRIFLFFFSRKAGISCR